MLNKEVPQISEDIEPPKDVTPERKLIAALILRAIWDCGSSDKHIKADAISWLYEGNREQGSLLWWLSFISEAPHSTQEAILYNLDCAIARAPIKRRVDKRI